jgi:hypothetical protein
VELYITVNLQRFSLRYWITTRGKPIKPSPAPVFTSGFWLGPRFSSFRFSVLRFLFLFCLVYPMLSVSPIVSSFFLFFYLEESRAVHICWSSSIENKSVFESMLSTLSRTIPNWYLQIVQEYSLQMVYNFRHLPIRKSCNYFHPTLVIFFGVRHVSVFIFVTFSLRNKLLVVWYYVTNIG